MSVLLLSEDDVRGVVTMDMALEAVEAGLRKQALEEAQNVPRSRVQTDHAMLHVMSASAKSLGYLGAKVYCTSRRNPSQFVVTLFDGKTGLLACLMQADYLGQVRTGAASGVATKFMARPDSHQLGIYGSGKQARTQVEAICKVRPIKLVHVYSPNEEHRKAFAVEMSKRCEVEVVPVSRPEKAAEDMDVVVTATSSREHVLQGDWIAQGTHINAIGSNFLGKAEVDTATLRRCSVLVVDSKDQARLEAGDFQQGLEDGTVHWADVKELAQVIVGRIPGRKRPEDVTFFKSLGIALEDVALAGRVYERARAAGIGKTLDW